MRLHNYAGDFRSFKFFVLAGQSLEAKIVIDPKLNAKRNPTGSYPALEIDESGDLLFGDLSICRYVLATQHQQQQITQPRTLHTLSLSNTSPHLDIAYSGRMLDGMGVSKSSRCDGTQWNFNHIHSLISPHTRELLLLTDDVYLRKYSTRALRSNTGTTFEQISVPGKTWCFISCILCVRSSTCVFEG